MECIILAIDPGKRAGWCIQAPPCANSPDRYEISGAVETHVARCIVVGQARSIAEVRGLPLVIVAESHTRFGKWGRAAAAGTASTWGHWQVAIEEAHLDALPRLGRAKGFSGVVRVPAEKWYRAVVGNSRGWKQDGREAKLQRVMLRAGINDPDAACAKLIAEWASKAEAVRKVLPAAYRVATSEGAKR